MKIQEGKIRQIKITDVDRLDPIDATLEDIATGKGRINIRCYTKAWTAYWGAMGERTISQFFIDCSDEYLANNLDLSLSSRLTDGESALPAIKKHICYQRRKELICKDEARCLWDDADNIVGASNSELYQYSKYLTYVLGDDWWHSLPSRPNPEYEYLCRIIRAVQEALRDLDKPQPVRSIQLDLSKIPADVLRDIRLRDTATDEDIQGMTAEEAFTEYCMWNGIIGYAPSLIRALDGLRAATVSSN